MIRVGVIAPVLAIRSGLRAMLNAPPTSLDGADELEVIAEATSPEELERTASSIDVLVVTAIVASDPKLDQICSQEEGRLALLAITDDPQTVQSLFQLQLRAFGALHLDVSAEELVAAVYALHQGLLVGAHSLMEPLLARSIMLQGEAVDPLIEPLTERESQVLQLLAHGLANKQIAIDLGISEHTVKFHVSSIYTKLGATNRAEAVRKGIQGGLVLL